MAINLSGLNGRNVMFWKWCAPIKAYIVKYTKEGKYYALSKRSGMLYEFSQYTGTDTDGATGEEVRFMLGFPFVVGSARLFADTKTDTK